MVGSQGVLWRFETHPAARSMNAFESTDNAIAGDAFFMTTVVRHYLHSVGAYFASNVGVAPNVNPVGALAPFAMQRQATTDCSGMLNSAVASGNRLAAVASPV